MEKIGMQETNDFFERRRSSRSSAGLDVKKITELKTGTQQERRTASEKIIAIALQMITEKYGSGIGDGENPKAYHNVVHTKGVVDAARKIARLAIQNGKIEATDDDILAVAASFHDIEQDLGGGANERESTVLLEENMEKNGSFMPLDFKKVNKIIPATIVSFNTDGVMKQSATDDYLTKIMADADLSALGQPSDIYWGSAQALLREIKKTDSPSLLEQLAWAREQVKFLSNHQFYTKEAKELFPHKEENIEFAKEQIKRLEAEINQVN